MGLGVVGLAQLRDTRIIIVVDHVLLNNMPCDGRDHGHNSVVVGSTLADHRGQIMKMLASAQLFAAPARAAKSNAKLERAKLVIVAARERAAETARQCAAQPSTMRPPKVLQRRRLVGKFSEKY